MSFALGRDRFWVSECLCSTIAACWPVDPVSRSLEVRRSVRLRRTSTPGSAVAVETTSQMVPLNPADGAAHLSTLVACVSPSTETPSIVLKRRRGPRVRWDALRLRRRSTGPTRRCSIWESASISRDRKRVDFSGRKAISGPDPAPSAWTKLSCRRRQADIFPLRVLPLHALELREEPRLRAAPHAAHAGSALIIGGAAR